MKYLILFITIYLTAYWEVVLLLAKSLFKKREVKVMKDKFVTGIITKKANLELKVFRIIKSDMPFGFMVGLTGKPVMALSSKLYKTFTKDELEFVVLHEAGHFVLKHSIKEAVVVISAFVIGSVPIFLSNSTLPIAGVLATGFVLGLIVLKYGTLSEIEAEKFMLGKISSPVAVISASKKFQNVWRKTPPENSLVFRLFYRGLHQDKRIRMAKEEIKRRAK